MSAPWSPMVAPPLVCRNDVEFDTCAHGYPAEECMVGRGRACGCTHHEWIEIYDPDSWRGFLGEVELHEDGNPVTSFDSFER